ncbi:myotubularin-related protein 10-B [Belonocnema kinseyi]|uniref:myotubularin-related protein 10-B n=1 Tax=Belonocnema kinseyi TaxID=2817044 RepID=UPI00143D4246|nr:myotubularin-related protein 10-B [Belonocnema kinseyi]
MENKSSRNFISYVDLEEHEMENLGSSRGSSFSESNIKLLPGESIAATAKNVLMFSPVGDFKQGISGILVVTNFKLTFLTSEHVNGEDAVHQQNNLYGYTDTCLSNIDAIYLIIGDKKRRLVPRIIQSSKIKGRIFIVCKNLRTWSFSFKFSSPDHGQKVVNALLHHAFPSRHQLLFAYDYKEKYYCSIDKGVRLFRHKSEWENELDRTSCKSGLLKRGWRLSTANEQFQISPSLPEYIIVPGSVTDSQLINAAQHFQDNRPPIWSWSNERGAALVKMAELSSTITERTQENIMLENIRKSHPRTIQPIVIELNKEVGVKTIAASFSKFASLCSPENIRQFWIQDNVFYSLLENTKWLKYVSHCLQKAVETCDHLNEGESVILQEGNGRDICCIVSSLTQLLLDPYFRTITGFQSLLQKEWIAAGHPFCDRLGYIISEDSEKSPLLLLFLDCVWQLCQQFPAEFEFTETYLTTLWDAAHVSVFDTFIFNCERDRIRAAHDRNIPLVLRSVWDWREQFSDQDILLFYNPLFNQENSRDHGKRFIKPLYSISSLELWSQCYFRWIPPLEIHSGGRNHIELYTRLVQNDVAQLKVNANGNRGSPVEKLTTYLVQMNIDSFYPFSNKRSGNTVSTPIMNSSMLMNESLLDAQSLLTAPD